jgi:serine/threonine protein kinase
MAKVKNLRKETDILMEKHALNKLYDTYKESSLPCVKLVGTFKDSENLYFLMELLPQSKELWNFCRNFGLLSDFECLRTFKAICEAVAKVHAVNIVHRDLKPENMFRCDDNTVKLIDFGSA